ncbi:hypothetical protein [Kitasatospora sp. NPDC096204]|uniref:hypothetical protein n=1 Tax=Kitasatospora sp. NPDC096204 TaxID=3364094 RepID=UPI00380E769D
MGQGLSSRYLCVQAHVAGIGWQADKPCPRAVVGRAIEALRFISFGMSGLCARAHVATVGWQLWVCVRDNVTLEVGTTGQSLAIEAVEVQTQSGLVVLNMTADDIKAGRIVLKVGFAAVRRAEFIVLTVTGTSGRG